MARHFAPSDKKKIKLPNLRIPDLPKLFTFKNKRMPVRQYHREFSVQEMVFLLAATLLFILVMVFRFSPVLELVLLIVSALLAFLPALFRMARRVFSGKLPDEDALVLVGIAAAFAIGEGIGGAVAAILYRLTQILEAYALAKGDAALDQLRDQLPEKARIEIGDLTQEIMPESVEPGQVLLVEPGEMIPLDGVILSGITTLDQSFLTGSEKSCTVGAGDEVFSGSRNSGQTIRVKVTRSFAESAACSLLRDVESSARYQTDVERLSDRISAWCGLAVGILALLLAVIPSLISGDWVRWIRCAVIFLLVASPSTLALSVPLACLGAEISGMRRGILSKGHDCFEVLARVRTMVFGKTGTITEGRYEITGIVPSGVSQEDLLAVAVAAESGSHHPIAMVLKRAAGWTPEIGEGVMELEEIPGRGVSAFIEGRHVYVGNAALLEEHGVRYAVPARAGAAIHVAVESKYWGHILISDKTREGSFDALESLRSQGVDQLVMLTGDVLSSTRQLASSLGFDLMRTELTTEGKVSAIDYLISGKGKGDSVGFVGDGINDAPMLERADVGLAVDALQAWSEADAADILLLDDDISQLPTAMRIARSLRRILWEDLGVVTGVKVILMLLALLGFVPVSIAAVCAAVSSALALLNSLRAFGLE